MAEIAASIVALSAFGIQLTDTLYKFGSNFSAARAQSNRISDRITDYTTILGILEATIEADVEIFSRKAVELIEKLCDQSYDLFYDIRDLLPSQREGGGRNDVSFSEKIMWNFRKSRIELLLSEIEYVKSNVLLLIMTALVGKKIRSQKRRKKQKNQNRVEKEDEVIQQQALKAKNAIVQHMNATENLSRLQMQADETDSTESATQGSSKSTVQPQTSRALIIIDQQNEVLANFQEALTKVGDLSERQALVIQRSAIVLQDLINLWTTVDTDRVADGDAVGIGATKSSQDFPDDESQIFKVSRNHHFWSSLSDGMKLRVGQDIDPMSYPGTSYWTRARRPYLHEKLPGEIWENSRENPPGLEAIDCYSTAGSEIKGPIERLQRDFPGYRNTYKLASADSDDEFNSNDDDQDHIYVNESDIRPVSPQKPDQKDAPKLTSGTEHRLHMPSFERSQTMPAPRSSSTVKTMPSRISRLKHPENDENGYGASRRDLSNVGEQYPSRRNKQKSTKYQIIDPSDSDEDLPNVGEQYSSRHNKQKSTKYHIIDPADSDKDLPTTFTTSKNIFGQTGLSRKQRAGQSEFPESGSRSDRVPIPSKIRSETRGRHDA